MIVDVELIQYSFINNAILSHFTESKTSSSLGTHIKVFLGSAIIMKIALHRFTCLGI